MNERSTHRAHLVSAFCPGYPSALCDLPDAPGLFRFVGTLPAFDRSIAIVGTRRCDPEASDFAYDLARHASLAGVVVVSGGAVGVDRAAHEGALDAGGATVAVLPTGLRDPYPRANRDLFDRIAGAGCLLTEVDDGVDAQPGRFLKRNRLVAALGGVTVVVQAPARSGALSTARVARRLDKPVFVVPASPWDPRGAGNLRLVRQGARICTRPSDVLSDCPSPGGPFGGESVPNAESRSDFNALTESQRAILVHLEGRARHPDELCQRTGIPAFEVQQSILTLLVQGRIEEKPGGRYQSCRPGGKPY